MGPAICVTYSNSDICLATGVNSRKLLYSYRNLIDFSPKHTHTHSHTHLWPSSAGLILLLLILVFCRLKWPMTLAVSILMSIWLLALALDFICYFASVASFLRLFNFNLRLCSSTWHS